MINTLIQKFTGFGKNEIIKNSGLVITAVILFMTLFFSLRFYQKSITTKSEIRSEILEELKNSGKGIYEINDYQQLQQNTDIMNKWMKKNPRDAERFLKFKEGYESR